MARKKRGFSSSRQRRWYFATHGASGGKKRGRPKKYRSKIRASKWRSYK